MAGSTVDQSSPWYTSISNAIKQSPFDVKLLIVSTVVFYKVVSLTRWRRQRRHRKQQLMGPGPIALVSGVGGQRKEELPALRSDFTVAELREYNGTREDGRILVAINFKIYDVSRSKHLYGRDGIYPNYAGRDISRKLINFSVETNNCEEFDDLSHLNISQINTLREWDLKYSEKYPFVGNLLREGEPHNYYEDEEDELEHEIPYNQ